ncbi:hypothetical protein KVV02_000003 [Mortierella alpina]|uniref:CCDC174 alpha/beta GRSR domain-containing protein n=1 Tax=Mortierella alpina TaxID=64518 RepID=A0A9P8D1S9_MORAP|nr:hypothetical protein KVV02_000003 [Mortierella alpina]
MAAVPDKKTFDKGAVVKTDSASLIAFAAAVAKHDERFQHAKGTRSGIRAPRSVKKTSIWQRKNPGLAKRASKHDGPSPNEDPDGESARKAAMERKSKMYEMLKRGEDVPDRLREELLVEFEYKNRGHGSSDDDDSGSNDGRRYRSRDRRRSRSRSKESDWDRDESVALSRDPRDYKNDPWVEHVDEFGRSRLVRQSEVPEPEPEPEPRYTPGIHNPANPFPVFLNQDAVDKQEWIRDATGEMRSIASQRKSGGGYSLANTTRHYNSAGERRAHGVGFYAFSQDEDERQRQMRELIEMRSQTETKRSQHRSLRDKRREEIEARKRLIQKKRLKSLVSTISMEPKG